MLAQAAGGCGTKRSPEDTYTSPECGDGILSEGEECDDGAAISDTDPDACRSDCRLPWCGDGVADDAEECDGADLAGADCISLGFQRGTLGCRATCQLDTAACERDACGDGVITDVEECDDGNAESGDGCSATCAVEPGWVCGGEGGVPCGAEACGDGIVAGDEVCDDQNTAAGDGCAADCTGVELGWDCAEGSPTTCACATYYQGAACDECRVLVSAAASAGGNGVTWPTALTTIQQGIAVAAAQPTACEVWVAAGSYRAWVSARTDTILLAPGVDVYGGFAGTEAARSDRDWNLNVTTLDGNEPLSTWRRVYHVVTGADDARLDGFTVSGGRANGTGEDGCGGGLLISGRSTTVANCLFVGNEAVQGGGLCARDFATPVVSHSRFTENHAEKGGALASLDATSTFTEVTVQANTAATAGGGGFLVRSQVVMMGGEVSDNEAALDGGGLMVKGGTTTLENVSLTGNQALAGGAVELFDQAQATLEGAVIADNQAQLGAGLFVSGATLTLRDTEVTGGRSPEANGARGAGLYAVSSAIAIAGGRFDDNHTGAHVMAAGGAAYFSDCAPVTITGTSFANNASGAGGALWSEETELEVRQCSFVANIALGGAQADGGAIAVAGGDLVLLRSTLQENQAANQGGAVAIVEASEASVVACLVTDNVAGLRGGGLFVGNVPADGGGAPRAILLFNTVAANSPAPLAASSTVLGLLSTILDAGPALDNSSVQAEYCLAPAPLDSCATCWEGLPSFEGAGDFHLQQPLADTYKGDPNHTFLQANRFGTNVDLDGTGRQSPPTIGCYEAP